MAAHVGRRSHFALCALQLQVRLAGIVPDSSAESFATVSARFLIEEGHVDSRRFPVAVRVAILRLCFVIFVDGGLFQIPRIEDLIAVHAPQVIDAIAAHQELGLFMLAGRHKGQIHPIL